MSRVLIRRTELRRRVPYSDVHIWRLERDGQFPHRVQLGPHTVAWYEDEVEAWCASRIRAGAHRPLGRTSLRRTGDAQ
jgi:prophage regulatory protein